MRVAFDFAYLNLTTLFFRSYLLYMLSIKFSELQSHDDIARAFSCSPSLINTVIERAHLFYEQKFIPKKGNYNQGKYRIVYKVKSELNNLQKNISTAINSRSDFPDCVQGFVKKRSIATNASLHRSQQYFLHIDIKDFFDSITKEQVAKVFKIFGCIDEIANTFAYICTLDGKLVQGASTSPVLANLVCKELDQDLTELAEKSECIYSRYADDITFSGQKVPNKKCIKKYLEKMDFN